MDQHKIPDGLTPASTPRQHLAAMFNLLLTSLTEVEGDEPDFEELEDGTVVYVEEEENATLDSLSMYQRSILLSLDQLIHEWDEYPREPLGVEFCYPSSLPEEELYSRKLTEPSNPEYLYDLYGTYPTDLSRN